MLWKALIARHGGHMTEKLDISSLSKVSDGYTPGHMNAVISQLLTDRRVQQVSQRREGGVSYLIPPIYTHSYIVGRLQQQSSFHCCPKLTQYTKKKRRPSGYVKIEHVYGVQQPARQVAPAWSRDECQVFCPDIVSFNAAAASCCDHGGGLKFQMLLLFLPSDLV